MVRIHYRRPPERLTIFEQLLVHDGEHVIVTLSEKTNISTDVLVNGEAVLEAGAPVVWFTFPGAAHDLGRFHRRDGRFTGLYANVITPVEFESRLEWRTTDLFLDIWLPADGSVPVLLDEDELEAALANRWIDVETAQTARNEADRLISRWRDGSWPLPLVHEWTLEQARAALKT
ncbi:MAG: DUF402 domain-containing protein [Gemmatimonadota bacterium]